MPILVCIAGLSGCYASTDYDRYPEGVEVQRQQVVREWVADDAKVTFRENGSFSAIHLQLEYFECPLGGVREKSGDGSWSLLKGNGGSEIIVQFGDGCSGTLRAGERDDKSVLWGSYSDRDDVLILK
ncbi:hypothetical protein [Streptomyces sp. AC627_RSS907]|uniref:hypothetical protein n=1 Tax=Streptomyces sp. AC627_RSS907 TaxID=2823684 RepID=UPI001C21FA98|nr:hypothetical protein [Streptomyces sp. AC627_RSS907]